jgi:regulatory protein YycH of two-component signal transduction system YycFG
VTQAQDFGTVVQIVILLTAFYFAYIIWKDNPAVRVVHNLAEKEKETKSKKEAER